MPAKPINPFEMSDQSLITLQITFTDLSDYLHRPLRSSWIPG